MAELSVRGYAKFVKEKSYNGGTYKQYSLNVKQKGRKGAPDTWANFQVTDFTDSHSQVTDGCYLTVKGYLTVSKYTKDGVEKQSLDVKATEVEVAPPKDGSAPPAAPQKAPAPGSADFPEDDDIPF